jgi:ADP-ribose pyrophosphatase
LLFKRGEAYPRPLIFSKNAQKEGHMAAASRIVPLVQPESDLYARLAALERAVNQLTQGEWVRNLQQAGEGDAAARLVSLEKAVDLFKQAQARAEFDARMDAYMTLIMKYPNTLAVLRPEGQVRIIYDRAEVFALETAKKREAAAKGEPADYWNFGIRSQTAWHVMLFEPVLFADGKTKGGHARFMTRATLNGSPGSVVLPIMKDGRIALVIQSRHALDGAWTIELPRGAGNNGEKAVATAMRELKEEVGAQGKNPQSLGTVCPNSGHEPGGVGLFKVEIDKIGEHEREPSEAGMGVVFWTREELEKAIVASQRNGGYYDVTVNGKRVNCLMGIDAFTLSALCLDHLHTKYSQVAAAPAAAAAAAASPT